MTLFLVHLLLTCALVLILPIEQIWLSWLAAFVIGYAIISFWAIAGNKSRYHIHLYRAVILFFYFHYELLTSSLKVLWDIITPQAKSKPGFIALPLEAKTDAEIFFTANLISLTPGTLSMDVSADKKTLYIHAMFIHDLEQTIDSLKHFEAKILGVFR